MLLSTQTSRLQNKFGYEVAIRILAGSGFDAFDLSLFRPVDDNDKLYKRNFRAYAKSLRDLADSLGIRCNQSHAPFPSSVGDPEKDAEIFKSIVHAMEIASILGADHIVVHPKQHMPYRENAAKLKEINMRFYNELIPYCKKFGIKVALENMWQMNPIGGKTIVDSTCSRVEEFCDYLDTLDSPYFGACLDTGHVSLCGEDMGVMIRGLGKRLKALHVHDTDGYRDLHTLPYTAGNDFGMIMRLLSEIGYEGDLTFEADTFYRGFTVELYPDVAAFMGKVGRHLVKTFNESK